MKHLFAVVAGLTLFLTCFIPSGHATFIACDTPFDQVGNCLQSAGSGGIKGFFGNTSTHQWWDNIDIRECGNNDDRICFNDNTTDITTFFDQILSQISSCGNKHHSNRNCWNVSDIFPICDNNLNAAGAQSNAINAVPEPSTWILLGSGLVGLAAFRRRTP